MATGNLSKIENGHHKRTARRASTLRAIPCPDLPIIWPIRHFQRSHDMEKPPLHHVLVAVQRPIVGVIGVGRDEDIVRPGHGPHGNHHRRVGKYLPAVLKPELDEVAGAQEIHVHLDAHRAVGGLGPGHEVPEKLHPRPGWRTVGGVDIVPAEFRREVHDPGAGIQALGRKVGAVPADLTEIIEGRVAGVGPFVGISHRRPAVIREQLDHAASPLSRHPMPAVILLTPTGKILPGFVAFDHQKPELLLAFSGGEC